MGGGNNPKRRAVTPDGTRFVVKWSKNNDNRVPEINERDQLTAVLGSLVGVPVVQAWVVPSSSLPDAGLPPDEANAPLVRDKCVVMPFLGGPTVAMSKPASAIRVAWNPAAVADIFAFMHWIGDEDRGLDDVILDGDRLVLIDNGLCGPGRPESPLRGYHPQWEVFREENRLKKCYGGKPSLVAFVFRDLRLPHGFFASPPVIERINDVTHEELQVLADYCGVERRVADVLIGRKASLASDFQDWFGQVSRLFGGAP
jgi:hypothetical protein